MTVVLPAPPLLLATAIRTHTTPDHCAPRHHLTAPPALAENLLDRTARLLALRLVVCTLALPRMRSQALPHVCTRAPLSGKSISRYAPARLDANPCGMVQRRRVKRHAQTGPS
jgi:hypothetical protein